MISGRQSCARSIGRAEFGSGAHGIRSAFAMAVLALTALLAHVLPLAAGELDRAEIAKYYPEPYLVGERDRDLPIWPLFRHAIPASEELLGYVFESIDLTPIAGYAGTPPNLLVAIGPDGAFLGVNVISHKEPIFQHGVSEETLVDFARQYRGLSVKQSIKLAPAHIAGRAVPGVVSIDGVSRATVSVRIMNESVLSSALKVARAKLGLSPPSAPAVLKPDDGATFEPVTLLAKSYLHTTQILTEDVVRSFGPSFPKDADQIAGADPDAAATDVWAAYLNIPAIGRGLLGKAGFDRLMNSLKPGDHAILVASRGRYGFREFEQRPGAVPQFLAITQDSLPIDVSDAMAVEPVASQVLPGGVTWTALKVIAEAGFDPARPWQLAMRITRKNTEIFPRRETKDFATTLTAPAEFFSVPEVELEGWRAVWKEQRFRIALVAGALLVLSLGLFSTRKLTANARSYNVFRLGFLAVTLGGIGWWAQGQLSIHNILAVMNAAKQKGDFAFLLFDPVSLLLWIFVLGTLAAFGRGTFCGWLCPFGAFQEFAANAARAIGIGQITVPYAIDRKLRLVKYAVLAAIILAAFVSTPVAEKLAEAEPFKTAITLGFDRAWPYVIYAVGLLGLSAFVFKGYCLYVCPLGAALALAGRVRTFDWIARRSECGTPCQLCAVRCRYGSIEPSGQVRYDECFQCLDCVAIYNDERTCVPLVLARKGRAMSVPPAAKDQAARVPIRPVRKPEGVT
ncbi:MAG TPA: 4Fe-4S binding protein [Hyphomicrobium sp.]|nr:4Fe-4S binding protein [Hyphomicrobium sp.]